MNTDDMIDVKWTKLFRTIELTDSCGLYEERLNERCFDTNSLGSYELTFVPKSELNRNHSHECSLFSNEITLY